MDAAARNFFPQTFNLLVQYILLDPLKNGQIMYTINFNDGLSLNSFNKKKMIKGRYDIILIKQLALLMYR